jgi:hypothetical protein
MCEIFSLDKVKNWMPVMNDYYIKFYIQNSIIKFITFYFYFYFFQYFHLPGNHPSDTEQSMKETLITI